MDHGRNLRAHFRHEALSGTKAVLRKFSAFLQDDSLCATQPVNSWGKFAAFTLLFPSENAFPHICLQEQPMADTPRIDNRKARQYYEFLEFFEAGIVLTGPEVKSIRAGQVSFGDSFVECREGEAFVVGMRIAPYDRGGYVTQEPDRDKNSCCITVKSICLPRASNRRGLPWFPPRSTSSRARSKWKSLLPADASFTTSARNSNGAPSPAIWSGNSHTASTQKRSAPQNGDTTVRTLFPHQKATSFRRRLLFSNSAISLRIRLYRFLPKLARRYSQKSRSATERSGIRMATTGTSWLIPSRCRLFSTTSPLATRRSCRHCMAG